MATTPSNTNLGRDYVVPEQIDGPDLLTINAAESKAIADANKKQLAKFGWEPTPEEIDWDYDPLKGVKLNNDAPEVKPYVASQVPALEIPNWGYCPNPDEALHVPSDATPSPLRPIIPNVVPPMDQNWNWHPNAEDESQGPQDITQKAIPPRFNVDAPADFDWGFRPNEGEQNYVAPKPSKGEPLTADIQPRSPRAATGGYTLLTAFPQGGIAPFTYQWMAGNNPQGLLDVTNTTSNNNVIWAGATEQAMSVSGVHKAMYTYFRCVITDANGQKALTPIVHLTVY